MSDEPRSPEPGGWVPPEPPAASAGPGWGAPQQGPAAPPPPGWGTPPPPGWGAQPAPGWGAPYAQPKGGDARTGDLPLHPMTLADLFDGAFKILKADAAAIATIVLVLAGPATVLSAFATRGALGGEGLLSVFNDPTLIESPSAAPSLLDAGAAIVSGLLSVLVLPFIGGAISLVVAGSYLGRPLSGGAALRAMFGKGWALLGAFFLVHLVEMVGFMLCVLPGVAAMAFYVLVAPAIAVERLGPLQGMRRSQRLVSRRGFWPVLGIVLLAGFVSGLLGSVLGVGPQAAAMLVGLRWGWIILAAGGLLVQLVVAPLVTIIATLQYFDARIRTEGFDLEVMAASMRQSGASA